MIITETWNVLMFNQILSTSNIRNNMGNSEENMHVDIGV